MRSKFHTTVRNFIVAGSTCAALMSPVVASARPAADVHGQLPVSHALVDLRSPDAATPVKIAPLKVDLRSPDAATPVKIAPVKVDLRSPDAATPVHAPTATKVPQPQTIGTHGTSGDDFDFGSAAVGAGIALLVALACLGSMVAINRRRSPISFGS